LEEKKKKKLVLQILPMDFTQKALLELELTITL